MIQYMNLILKKMNKNKIMNQNKTKKKIKKNQEQVHNYNLLKNHLI